MANLLVGLMLLGVAAALTYFSLDFFRSGVNSVNWPQTQGKIIKSSMIKREDEDNVEYLADIEYEYVYHNQSYFSRADRTLGSDTKEAKKYFEAYLPGSTITFYFDPQNPSKTVQFPGLQTSHYARIAIIGLFVLMGLSFLLR